MLTWCCLAAAGLASSEPIPDAKAEADAQPDPEAVADPEAALEERSDDAEARGYGPKCSVVYESQCKTVFNQDCQTRQEVKEKRKVKSDLYRRLCLSTHSLSLSSLSIYVISLSL